MKKRFLQIATVVSILIVALTFCVSAKSEYAYKYSGKAYDASIKYLNEFYLEKHPDFALKNSYSAPNDWAYLEKALKPIIKGCNTDAQKADAIVKWINENINYNADAFYQFPKDVYVAKESDCLGFAYLTQQFLRLADIPAVVCTGWHGDLVNTIDKDFINNSDYPRHAWILAYINNKWIMYDPSSQIESLSNRAYIIKWYFFEEIEGIIPYCSKKAIDWFYNGTGCYYRDGKFIIYTDGKPALRFLRIANLWYQYSAYSYVDSDGTYSGMHYIDPKSKKLPDKSESYTDAMISYAHFNSPFYAQYNGIFSTSTINKIDGEYYYFNQSGTMFRLNKDVDEYYLLNSAPCVIDGEKIPVTPFWYEEEVINGHTIEYECVNPDFASIDKNGCITMKKEGGSGFIIRSIDKDTGQERRSDTLSVHIVSANSKHDINNDFHVFDTEIVSCASQKSNGKIVKTCAGCSKTITSTIPKIKSIKLESTKFDYTGSKIIPLVTIKNAKNKTLVYGTDYTLSYKNNKAIGKATVTVNFIGKYSGTVSKTFKIVLGKPNGFTVSERKIDSLSLAWCPVEGATQYYLYVYSKKKDKYVLLKKTKNTDFEYENLTPGKTYKFRVKAVRKKKGKTYSSSYVYLKTATKPKKVSLNTLESKKKKQAVVTWKTVSGATGYEVKYSTSKKFTKKTTSTVTVKEEETKKTTLKKLTSGKKYYVKVRAYKTVDGKKIYGAYSSVKTVKVK